VPPVIRKKIALLPSYSTTFWEGQRKLVCSPALCLRQTLVLSLKDYCSVNYAPGCISAHKCSCGLHRESFLQGKLHLLVLFWSASAAPGEFYSNILLLSLTFALLHLAYPTLRSLLSWVLSNSLGPVCFPGQVGGETRCLPVTVPSLDHMQPRALKQELLGVTLCGSIQSHLSLHRKSTLRPEKRPRTMLFAGKEAAF